MDGHVCFNSNLWLLFIVCWPRKTNFHFPFAANQRKLPFSVSSLFRVCVLYIYIIIYIYIYIYMLLFQTENGSPGDFSWSIYRLLIVQIEICRLSICWRRNKRKLSVCKRTRWTKRTCLSIYIRMNCQMVNRFTLRVPSDCFLPPDLW
jgi:hypothetical protein